MKKYRGFEGEVPTLGLLRSDLQYRYPELYASAGYRGPLQATRIAPVPAPVPVTSAQVSPLQPPPVIMVPPSPPTGWYDPPVTLPPPVPGTGPVDTMLPDVLTDDYFAPSPESIGPTSIRGAGPAGDITGKTPAESTAFPYTTNGAQIPGAEKAPALGGAAIFAAIALFVLMGG